MKGPILISHLMLAILALGGCNEAQEHATVMMTSDQQGGDAGMEQSVTPQDDAGATPAGGTTTPVVPSILCRVPCSETSDTCRISLPLSEERQRVIEIWRDQDTCGTAILAAVTGECADGTLFVFHTTGHTSEVRYYEPSGQILAVAIATDDGEMTCLGQAYWPSFVICAQPVVTETLCGDYAVGDSVPLPWSAEVNASRAAAFSR